MLSSQMTMIMLLLNISTLLFSLAVTSANSQTVSCPIHCKCQAPWMLCKGGKIEDLANFSDNKITALSLHNYDLRTLEPNTLSGIKLQIWKLQITRSNIHDIKSNAFSSLNTLENLELNMNNIETIERDSFAGLSKLSTINLQNNNIKSLDDEVFEGTQLNHLHLDHNQLTGFGPVTFRNVRHITLRDNPLECNCDLKKLRKSMIDKIIGATCGSPYDLKGKPWDILESLNC